MNMDVTELEYGEYCNCEEAEYLRYDDSCRLPVAIAIPCSDHSNSSVQGQALITEEVPIATPNYFNWHDVCPQLQIFLDHLNEIKDEVDSVVRNPVSIYTHSVFFSYYDIYCSLSINITTVDSLARGTCRFNQT
jgi:hypothetical protein